jgi:hypothetical protein
MRVGFTAVREEIRAGDVLGRIAILQEPSKRPRRKKR